MATVSVKKAVKAPAAKVWAMVSEWGGTHKWIPGVGPVTVEPDGQDVAVGSKRSADLDPATGFPGRITEILEALDENAMHFRYSVLGASPIPIKNYVAEMKVLVVTNGSSEVTWSSTWDADGDLTEDELVTAFEGLYDMSLENVRTACE